MRIESVPWHEIKLPESRQRKDIPEKHIAELAESIKEIGLIHAITLNTDMTLIAGDCRRRAIKLLLDENKSVKYAGAELPVGYVPVAITHLMEREALFKLELEENIRRKNLTHLEQAAAIAELHGFNLKQNPEWTNKQTAEQLVDLGQQTTVKYGEREVADALILSQFEDDPDVQQARTKGAAVRIAKRKIEANVRTAFGADINTALSRNELIEGDSLEHLLRLDSETFDGIITDPPYGIEAQNFGEAGFLHSGHEYDDSNDYARTCYETLATEGFRVCKPESALYVFCDIRKFENTRAIFRAAGWDCWSTPIIWYKGTTAHAPKPDYGPKRAYETLLFCTKGSMRIQYCGLDVLVLQSVFRDHKLHPAEKPVELYAELIKWSFIAGSKLLDPFAGSGPIFPAANAADCTVLGVELDSSFAAIARGRMEDKE